MSAIKAIENAILAIGYRKEAVVRDYTFADVLNDATVTRKVAIAAFTQTPPSYRSAAFAVVEQQTSDAADLVQSYRALGAPLVFVIEKDEATLWQVRSAAPPRPLERLPVSGIPALFKKKGDVWEPQAIHRAKSIGAFEGSYQLDFVDLGLLPAIEGQIHTKLDRLLVEALDDSSKAAGSQQPAPRLLFRVIFRLLAAKVLIDRSHSLAAKWRVDDLASVLQGIESYYSLGAVPLSHRQAEGPAFSAIWAKLRQGISFSNISADDLAFVYENTLVTPEARKLFGTHSTPRVVAEYAVERLQLHAHDLKALHVYEPFSGAGIFLVSALRHLRDALPVELTDQQRHDFLVKHLAGDEIDPFACEVATLSLILADYPNHNGWHINEKDLFDDDVLADRMRNHNVILCNPPFAAFTAEERTRYDIKNLHYSKAVAALDAALSARPLALAFVLPRPFILEQQFVDQRRQIESLYGQIELVELPDRIFEESSIEAALVIAREPRKAASKRISLTSTEIADRDRATFLATGATTIQRHTIRKRDSEPNGDLWITPLEPLWDYLRDNPQFGTHLEIHRGIEWQGDQDEAWRPKPLPGYRRGLHSARNLKQFYPPDPVWLDCSPDRLLYRAIDRPWEQVKLIVNAARLSRGAWRMAATIDREGLVCSQQFFGLWPKGKMDEEALPQLTAVLNGPVANAFVAVHSPANRIRISALGRIPVPRSYPERLPKLVRDYMKLLTSDSLMRSREERLADLLIRIDAALLEAYDLPARLEKDLLAYFEAEERPVGHAWQHWDAVYPTPGLRLDERVSRRYRPEGNWVSEVFKPLPDDEAALLRDYGE